VNGIAFHPTHGTLATVGSDGRFSFWDKDARTKLKTSEQLDQPITCCCFNAHGNIFAYSSSYDWSKASLVVHWYTELRLRIVIYYIITSTKAFCSKCNVPCILDIHSRKCCKFVIIVDIQLNQPWTVQSRGPIHRHCLKICPETCPNICLRT